MGPIRKFKQPVRIGCMARADDPDASSGPLCPLMTLQRRPRVQVRARCALCRYRTDDLDASSGTLCPLTAWRVRP